VKRGARTKADEKGQERGMGNFHRLICREERKEADPTAGETRANNKIAEAYHSFQVEEGGKVRNESTEPHVRVFV